MNAVYQVITLRYLAFLFRRTVAIFLPRVGGKKKFSFVSRATERQFPFRPRSNPIHFPFNCHLSSGPFHCIVIKWWFCSVPLCENDCSVQLRFVETIVLFHSFFCKRSLHSLFWNDHSLRWNNHSLRWNDRSLCWNDRSIRCLKTFVDLFKQLFHWLSWNDCSFC